jgi:hypothetical protein
MQVSPSAFRRVEGQSCRGLECYELTHASVVARGVMLAGIVWQVEGAKSRAVECAIFWFALFSFYDVVVDLTQEGA